MIVPMAGRLRFPVSQMFSVATRSLQNLIACMHSGVAGNSKLIEFCTIASNWNS